MFPNNCSPKFDSQLLSFMTAVCQRQGQRKCVIPQTAVHILSTNQQTLVSFERDHNISLCILKWLKFPEVKPPMEDEAAFMRVFSEDHLGKEPSFVV